MTDLRDIVDKTFVADVEHYETLESTNDLAKQRGVQSRGKLPLLIIADHQTAGRGRGSNRWWTGQGSLAMSLLLEADHCSPPAGSSQGELNRAPMVALATAVALVETIGETLASTSPKTEMSSQFGLHWPNDVIADGRKIAGILVEVLPNGRQVIGIGLNTNNRMTDAPEELRHTATTLREISGESHDQFALLISLLGKMDSLFRQMASDSTAIGKLADTYCLQHGRRLSLQLGNRTFEGTCRGIASDGALLLETPEGLQSYYSGVLVRK